jgi:hypothetical protein
MNNTKRLPKKLEISFIVLDRFFFNYICWHSYFYLYSGPKIAY